MYEFESIAHVDPVVTEVELQGESTQVTGRIDFPPPPPQMEFPPGQWSQNTQGIWNQYSHLWNLVRCCEIGVLGAGQDF